MWRDSTKKFQTKLEELLKLIDNLNGQGHKISLIGSSAGGSAVLNAFLKRKNIIHKVVNICGRLRQGPQTGFWSFKNRTKTSPAFAESVITFESKETELTAEDKKKILTIPPLFDEGVPASAVIIPGALNKTIPIIDHYLGIIYALYLFPHPIQNFILNE